MQVANSKTKDLIEILDFGFKTIDAYRLSMADGSFNLLTDGANFVSPAIALPAAFNGYEKVWTGFKDWTQVEKDEVYAFVDERFPDLSDDVREELIEETIKEVIGDFQLAAKWAFYTKNKKLPTATTRPVEKEEPVLTEAKAKLKTVPVAKK